jgi:hypothetical protein
MAGSMIIGLIASIRLELARGLILYGKLKHAAGHLRLPHRSSTIGLRFWTKFLLRDRQSSVEFTQSPFAPPTNLYH